MQIAALCGLLIAFDSPDDKRLISHANALLTASLEACFIPGSPADALQQAIAMRSGHPPWYQRLVVPTPEVRRRKVRRPAKC